MLPFELALWWPNNSLPVGGTDIPATMDKFTRDGGILNVARYRWNWQKRAVQNSASDYTTLSNLVEAVANPAAANYASNVAATLDSEQWMRVLALRRLAGDGDSYGFSRGQNMYAYKPQSSGWQLLNSDMEYALHNDYIPADQSFFGVPEPPASDPKLTDIIAHPQFRRAFWRAIQDLVNGPFQSANVSSVMSSNAAAFSANGINPDKHYSLTLAWVTNRHSYATQQLATVACGFAITNNGGTSFTTNASSVLLAGKAPPQVKFLALNSTLTNVTWTTVTNWSLSVTLTNGANTFTVQGYDRLTNSLSGTNACITITKP